MIITKWNDNWKFTKGSTTLMSSFMGGLQFHDVQLPHDAMVHEVRTPDTGNGAQTGFCPGGVYTYIKDLDVPEEWQDKTVMLEFEGVYETAMVYVNGELVETNLYGYSNFYVVLDKYLYYGRKNKIEVIADNAAEKNSRWYSGSGIYRNVNLMVGSDIHIPADGVRVSTPSVSKESAEVEIATNIKNLARKRKKIKVETLILYDKQVVATDVSVVTMFSESEELIYQKIVIENPKLWNVETPELYECVVKVLDGQEVLDEIIEKFGIRWLELDAKHGLRINGETVKLRGACIHHDNGVIGAATFEKAEERRCKQLKEAGFNSIRSAHHPMSKAMLNACDKYGMLVMDELTDMWTNHKNPNDFALNFLSNMDKEIESMVAKDYNHPSVILYSTGNEIPDIGTARGAQLNRAICNKFRRLDSSRYTTNAINGMLALGEKMEVLIQDIMKSHNEEKQPSDNRGKEEGASALNSMMALMTGETADMLACHPLMTECIEEASQAMDITGLNYLTGRHVLEKELHPNKTVVGTETYPADIVRLWDIVKNNDHVIGDYTWTGYDYLGEAGCGIFYYDGTLNFNGIYPDRIAYIGDIDLIGYRRPLSYLREIVFGLRKVPYIAVERVDKFGMEHSQTPWMLKDNIASWTWPGYEGKPTIVDVYSSAQEVELFLNGVSLGKKVAGEEVGYTTSYELTFEPGELVAVSYENGIETGRDILNTANDEIHLQVECEEEKLKADGEDLAFITVKLVDDNGIENLYAEREISIEIVGPGVLQGFGNADPRSVGSYDSTTWKTYDGYVMAVIRSEKEVGTIHVKLKANGCEEQEIFIETYK
ncbi:MAG TPA: DUF4982 domain-containing protein [Candidatus Merdenecus merdavium]|nr:DUF4982 domain-containing protein [Candidatus Merdenecus merdavium]